ncbi:MAG: hypothetical protein MJ223_01935 [Mycoplasmoidaceae bacterium]|nr:hypothetical protein [Mycoplasmoidaceae bacterium]
MKKTKLFALIPTFVLSTIPTFTTTGCSTNKLIYTQDVIDEFVGNAKKGINGIVSCPRPGGYYDAIVPYLKSRAKALAGLTDEDIHVDNAHNIYFDIPATSGFEDADMIILQGHSDMIVAGLTDEQAKTTPIDAVIENGTLHSRNYKTSLGADDGAGIAIALTILKNRDKFNHGPIRFLMTADEDIGMVGAKALDSS